MTGAEMNISPLQALVNEWAREASRARAETQMTLGQFIEALKDLAPERMVMGFGSPHSYRGYYTDLSFEPVEKALPAGELLKVAESCMGRVFTGYKGGDYLMGERTPLWMAEYGDASDLRLVGLNAGHDLVTPLVEKEVWR